MRLNEERAHLEGTCYEDEEYTTRDVLRYIAIVQEQLSLISEPYLVLGDDFR